MKEDIIYELFKITAKTGRFNLPSEEVGSGYGEVYSVSSLGNIDPKEIILVDIPEGDAVVGHVRLMDAGFEILHPRVLVNLLKSNKIPEDWKQKHNIAFLGAWYCDKMGRVGCNPLSVSVFWHCNQWIISYDDLVGHRNGHCIAVIKKKQP